MDRRNPRTRLIAVASAVIMMSLPLLAVAQPLAGRVPADAMLYVGWSGADDMGPGYAGSHLKAMLELAEVRRVVDDVVPKLMDKVAREEPGAADVANLVSDVLGPMWRRPTALYFGPVDLTDPKKPVPSIALLCDAGEGAPAMERQLEQTLRNAGRLPVEIGVRTAGGVVILTVGNAKSVDAMFREGAKTKSLQQVESFAAAMSAQKSPVIAAYLDGEAMVKFLDEAVEKGNDKKARDEWPRVRDALGLRGLKRVSFAQGFDGKDWGTHAFIEAPAPREGLFAGLDAEPVGDDMLRAIPSTATMAGVARLDLGGLFDGIRQAAGKLDPAEAKKMDQHIAQANEMLGLDIRKDVLGPLGDQWAYYLAPELTGRGPLGVVVVNRLKDAGQAQLTSDKLKELANEIIASQNKDPKTTIKFKQGKVGDVTVNYFAAPFVTPSWAIQNGNLYVGLYPQVVAAAAGHVSGEGKSILDHAGFAALRTRLGGGRAVSVQFYDLPKSAPTAYQVWLLVSSMAKFGDILGVDTPVALLPPLAKITEHLSVAGSVSWVDDKGWHFRSVTPFPGATVLASETAGLMDVQTSALLASILLPSLNRAREQANRVKSAANLRQIGMAVHIYANENKGKFPDDLSATIGELTPTVFANPRKSDPAPVGLEEAEQKAWILQNSDYEYVGKGLTYTAGADVVVAYEKPDGLSDGINVLFADAHVEWMPMAQAMETIEKSRKAKPAAK